MIVKQIKRKQYLEITSEHKNLASSYMNIIVLNISYTFIKQLSTPYRSLCDHILDTSEVFVPIVTCPEASPLVGALLQNPVSSISEDFFNALSSAHSRYTWIILCCYNT